MTVHSRITAPARSPDALFYEVKIKSELAHTVGLAVNAGMTPALCEAMSGALEIFEAGMPSPPSLENLRYDAAHWADIATPMELEAYTAAGLFRIERTAFAEKARKRVFMQLWNTFTEKQQSDFLKAMTTKGKGVPPP